MGVGLGVNIDIHIGVIDRHAIGAELQEPLLPGDGPANDGYDDHKEQKTANTHKFPLLIKDMDRRIAAFKHIRPELCRQAKLRAMLSQGNRM